MFCICYHNTNNWPHILYVRLMLHRFFLAFILPVYYLPLSFTTSNWMDIKEHRACKPNPKLESTIRRRCSSGLLTCGSETVGKVPSRTGGWASPLKVLLVFLEWSSEICLFFTQAPQRIVMGDPPTTLKPQVQRARPLQKPLLARGRTAVAKCMRFGRQEPSSNPCSSSLLALSPQGSYVTSVNLSSLSLNGNRKYTLMCL